MTRIKSSWWHNPECLEATIQSKFHIASCISRSNMVQKTSTVISGVRTNERLRMPLTNVVFFSLIRPVRSVARSSFPPLRCAASVRTTAAAGRAERTVYKNANARAPARPDSSCGSLPPSLASAAPLYPLPSSAPLKGRRRRANDLNAPDTNLRINSDFGNSKL